MCSLVITAAVITSPRWAFWLHPAIYSPIHRNTEEQQYRTLPTFYLQTCSTCWFLWRSPGYSMHFQTYEEAISIHIHWGGGRHECFSTTFCSKKSAAPGLDVWVRQCLIDSTASERNYFPCKTETKQNNHFLSCMVLSIPYIKSMQTSIWYLIYSGIPVGPLVPKSTILHFEFLTAV